MLQNDASLISAIDADAVGVETWQDSRPTIFKITQTVSALSCCASLDTSGRAISSKTTWVDRPCINIASDRCRLLYHSTVLHSSVIASTVSKALA